MFAKFIIVFLALSTFADAAPAMRRGVSVTVDGHTIHLREPIIHRPGTAAPPNSPTSGHAVLSAGDHVAIPAVLPDRLAGLGPAHPAAGPSSGGPKGSHR